MATKLNLDKLDLQIINAMMDNAEISYAELGKSMFVLKNCRNSILSKVLD